ncbi:MAG: hypothetical protein ACK5KQ_04360 [Anaerorhabdus sp.]
MKYRICNFLLTVAIILVVLLGYSKVEQTEGVGIDDYMDRSSNSITFIVDEGFDTSKAFQEVIAHEGIRSIISYDENSKYVYLSNIKVHNLDHEFSNLDDRFNDSANENNAVSFSQGNKNKSITLENGEKYYVIEEIKVDDKFFNQFEYALRINDSSDFKETTYMSFNDLSLRNKVIKTLKDNSITNIKMNKIDLWDVLYGKVLMFASLCLIGIIVIKFLLENLFYKQENNTLSLQVNIKHELVSLILAMVVSLGIAFIFINPFYKSFAIFTNEIMIALILVVLLLLTKIGFHYYKSKR